MSTLILFFNIFKVQCSLTASTRGQGLISPQQYTRMFNVYSDSVKHLKNWLFLVTTLNEESHAEIYSIDPGLPYQCSCIFSKFWHQINFLLDLGSYVYRMDNLSQEDVFLKKWLVSFFEDLGYVRGVVPPDAASKKQLQRLTETRLLMNVDSKLSRNVIFGE